MSRDDKERKALDKLNETPEERQKRRLEKKAKKEAKRKRENEEGRDLMGYTNEANPFGDSNLTEKFVWKLKNEKEEKKGTVRDPKAEAEKERRRREEIEKAKNKREQREREKAQWEEEKTRMQREQDAAANDDWEAKEDEFYLKQAKMAADIRIKQGRAKPIDILYKNLSMDSDFDFEMNEPYKIFTGLGLQQLEELKKDIRVFLELDNHKNFWAALDVVCEDELATAKKRDAIEKSKSKAEMMRYAGNTGMHESVNSDVHDIFKGKSSKELETLQASITQQIESGAALDVEYWETLLKQLTVFKAKAKLKEIHADLLRRKLAELEAKSGSAPTTTTEKKEPEKPAEPVKKEEEEPPAKKQAVEGFSQYARFEEEAEDTTVSAHKRKLQNEAKKYGMNISDRTKERILTEDEMYKQEAAIAMEEEEEELLGDIELPVDNKSYSKDDKFRPRKPRFFNRVHTGYEWNKYNQTHYDHDNPPPKIVQGYKFNIFYPDLLNKSITPTYKILPGEDSDTCTLIIHAGPPYEDIGFKIVNREWEYSHKKGFKCTFERGILHLWFNFKKYRYRR